MVCDLCTLPLYSKLPDANLCSCNMRRSSFVSIDPRLKLTSPIDSDYVTKRLESATVPSGTGAKCGVSAPDLLSASYFDVAVLRCVQ